MWDKLGAIVGLLIGVCLIIFRKRYTRLIVRKQLVEKATPKTTEYHRQLRESKLDGMLYRILGIAAVVVGVGFVLLSIPKFFPPSR